ncbi:MAG: SAM-dependent methyltransferase [Clostridiaceae bacterium]|jgi:tRNA (adenine22-N1)-methyltransferase|nr:SAM-dependent methyltransferase [Clostridiaceae bacterium]
MVLKGRIKFIANMIPECTILSDIGTDHAYIPIYSVKNQICKKAIACDIGEGPVAVANRNIKRHGMEDRVVTRIGSGFKPISEEELDVCVIAGMGGILITEILQEDINKAKKANKLILQPMNCIELVREWLYLNGFEITDEGLINEGFRIYNVIVAQWTGKIAKKELVYYYIGEKLIEKKDPLLKKYINRRIDLMDRVLKQMSAMKDQDSSLISDQRNIRNEISALLERINK